MTIGRGKWLGAALVAAAAAAVLAPSAQAELIERGNLFVRFLGGIDPTALPRTERAPIAVEVGGTVKTLSGEEPPALREIKIELNRGGVIDSRGLPDCHRSELAAASPKQAMAACGGSLVGKGAYRSKTAFPEQAIFPTDGEILAFSGVYEGREAILAHVYGEDPLPISQVIVFRIRHSPGTFGTVLTGELPNSINPHGYITTLSLRLFRRYAFHGRQYSYISAACAAPAGFGAATFPFARTSMAFADGRNLSSTLTRSCRVRH